jgi:hypothetical protein
MSNDPNDYEGNTAPLFSKPYTVKTKVYQEMDADGIIRVKTYKVEKTLISVTTPSMANGDMNMIEGYSKVNLTSAQNIGQLVNDLNL